MDDGGRRCALPGCDRAITTTDGRPERRYCSAAHRAAARQARRAATQQRGRPAPIVEALPWVRDPVEVAPGGAGPAPGTDVGPDGPGPPRGRPRPSRHRGRALAALGVAGVLAAGYAATDARPDPSPAVQATPEWEAADAWAQRAAVVLTSVNRQLDLLAQAEGEWRRLPESHRTPVPVPVAALEERRSVLQQRRAMLRSQLDAYRSLRRVQQELAISEQHLRAVEKALADAPPQGARSAEQAAAIAALGEQRDLRLRRRDAQRAELASLRDGVAAAVRAPLPDDAAATARVSRNVLELVRDGGTAPSAPSPTPPDATETGPTSVDGASPAAVAPPDTLAGLRKRAAEVAREARAAEAARRAGADGP